MIISSDISAHNEVRSLEHARVESVVGWVHMHV